MDRDIKIGIIVGFIVLAAIMVWTENSEYKQCLQAGSKAKGHESFIDPNNDNRWQIFAFCSKKITN